jgi:hypothetical protein
MIQPLAYVIVLLIFCREEEREFSVFLLQGTLEGVRPCD